MGRKEKTVSRSLEKYIIVVYLFVPTGMLKSIMKRKDGSNSSENRKKSLQFVGILNGGYVKATQCRLFIFTFAKINIKVTNNIL